MFLNFSDAAKFADVARSLYNGMGYNPLFSFPGGPPVTLPVTPYSILVFFKIFEVTDFAVIATSFFYFLLSLIFVFLLAKKIYKSNLVGALSTVAVGFNYDLINYATSGASESPFVFEIVAATYFISLKNKWGNVVALVLIVLMYLTRPQAFIYITGLLLYYLLLNLKAKKALVYFAVFVSLGLLADKFLLPYLDGKFFTYSILNKGTNILSQVGADQSASDQLRSGVVTHNFSIVSSLKKVFYNLYNFYKLLPQIINPYLFALFVIGIFSQSNDRDKKIFKMVSLFLLLTTFLVTAISIPFFRYIHPIIPLIYIVATATIVEIINSQFLIF